MADHMNMTPSEMDALNAAQVEFSLNPRFLSPLTKQFLQAPQRISHEVGKFSSAWLERRQEATQAMIEAGKRLSADGGADPVNAMKEIVDWQTHSMERMAEDVKDCTEMMAQCASTLFSYEIEPIGDNVENTKMVTKKGK
ncbi:hypothetical protein MUY35_16855 [Aliiroseovarius sp. S1339]|uniref:hypothetical protein n=1 Tax=Aliiroseovarius sp. S1339 TaxID=2936990 RepID=UPI0020BE9F42|nr:hypothetical protein [Aliiroseovarius sp. S1339]MCK8465532.1 hypothetical protein [Aliiroseovarius sp. S1339]